MPAAAAAPAAAVHQSARPPLSVSHLLPDAQQVVTV
jgi:hypothetical protein